MLFEDACAKIARYNQLGLHYNLVADAVYRALGRFRAPFSAEYRPYLIAALVAFDMGRTMGKGLARKYDAAAGGFAARLEEKLAQVKPLLEPLLGRCLFEIDLPAHGEQIRQAYDELAAGGADGLHERKKSTHDRSTPFAGHTT